MENIFNTLPLIPSPQGRDRFLILTPCGLCRRVLHDLFKKIIYDILYLKRCL
jgi:hypothetical protein